MLKQISLGVCLGLAAGGAFAQTPAPKPATPAPAAAPVGEPTAAQVALAREVIVGSGISRSFAVVIPQYLDQIGTNLTQTRPDLIRDLNVVMEQLKPEFDKRADEMIDRGARLYAQRMSEDELKTISGFFKSPAGIRYVDTQPLVLNDLFVALQSWSQKLSTDMMARVREEMKKKGHEL